MGYLPGHKRNTTTQITNSLTSKNKSDPGAPAGQQPPPGENRIRRVRGGGRPPGKIPALENARCRNNTRLPLVSTEETQSLLEVRCELGLQTVRVNAHQAWTERCKRLDVPPNIDQQALMTYDNAYNWPTTSQKEILQFSGEPPSPDSPLGRTGERADRRSLTVLLH